MAYTYNMLMNETLLVQHLQPLLLISELHSMDNLIQDDKGSRIRSTIHPVGK